jgi:hypothetical protein
MPRLQRRYGCADASAPATSPIATGRTGGSKARAGRSSGEQPALQAALPALKSDQFNRIRGQSV